MEPLLSDTPGGRIDAAADRRPASRRSARASGRQRVRLGLFLLLPLALVVGAYEYVTGGAVVSTDDAYVAAEQVGIATDVSGIVSAVDVADNQHVAAGQVLFRLRDLPYRLKLDRAEANLGTVRDDLEALEADYRNTEIQIREAQTDADYYATELRREQNLVASRVASASALDAARRDDANAQQRIASLRDQLAASAANLGGNPAIPVEQHPRFRDALAQRDEALRELRHTVVRAPFAGTVTDVPSIAPGKYLAASTTAFFLVDTAHAWIAADPKETQLTYVRPGQPVSVFVDTYPGLEWRGTVASISPAAAQEFSLLPAENTSGNWVKVVERIPMRVDVDTRDRDLPPLRVGMSVEIDIETGHARGLPHFVDTLLGRHPARVS